MSIKKTILFSILIMVFSVLLSSIMITKDSNISSNIAYREMKLQGDGAVEVSEAIRECKDYNFIDERIFCFREYIAQHYIYLERNDNERLTIQQLLNEGGDCLNWAMFWEMAAKQMGYKVKPIVIKIDSKSSHRYSIIYNSQGYCNVDQINADCYLY